MPSPTPPMSVTQAAAKSGEPARTIRYAIKTGALKADKLPGATGAYLIRPRELDRWIAKKRHREGERVTAGGAR
ncbi:helix-turn-helix domain-containing protein [Mycolicibacterium goodii]|uniref:helix-turn-helix domain-containing protein n=1 Tax=Mycolicibacterium goodii TaxID=134601 RepID=UPI001BDC807A|nr:helix-turn-helix domain-containing protein [Mycolicibacterium goodii]MBU8832458.1 helix-turn-helix domain-containing protein [Mycolicibacterium goodii]